MESALNRYKKYKKKKTKSVNEKTAFLSKINKQKKYKTKKSILFTIATDLYEFLNILLKKSNL